MLCQISRQNSSLIPLNNVIPHNPSIPNGSTEYETLRDIQKIRVNISSSIRYEPFPHVRTEGLS